MCSICPSGTYRETGNVCKYTCDCKEKGTESCNPSTGECICNSKAVSGSQNKCEIFSCHDDSDCTLGVCWRPKETTWTYSSSNNHPAGKIYCLNIYIIYLFFIFQKTKVFSNPDPSSSICDVHIFCPMYTIFQK